MYMFASSNNVLPVTVKRDVTHNCKVFYPTVSRASALSIMIAKFAIRATTPQT
jgi:hypothetical protein